MNTILITGAKGQLGSSLQQILPLDTCHVIALDKSQCNISDRNTLKKLFKEYQPNWVINTAAYNAVDKAETEKQQAYDINVEAVRYLAEESERHHAKLVHFSTDYVFSGNQKQPYTEADLAEPLSIYGKTKLLGEAAVQNTFDNFLIFRVSWLFSAYAQNFVKTIMHLLKEREFLKVVDDQEGCPTSTLHLAELVYTIITQNPSLQGLYHYCDNPIISKYGFACYIRDYLVENCHFENKNITPIASSEFPTAAVRPAFSALDCTKLTQNSGLTQKNWQLDVNRILKELMHA